MKFKTILRISSLLAVLLIIIVVVCSFSPAKIFQRKFGFNLPESAKILNYDYFFFDEGRLYLKVSFGARDFDEIKRDIFSYVEKYTFRDILYDNTSLPNFINTCTWWDMNEDELELAYSKPKRGKRVMTVWMYLFVVKNVEDQYFLYVVN